MCVYIYIYIYKRARIEETHPIEYEERPFSYSIPSFAFEIPHQLEIGTSVSEDAGPQRGRLWNPISVEEGNETLFIRVKTCP